MLFQLRRHRLKRRRIALVGRLGKLVVEVNTQLIVPKVAHLASEGYCARRQNTANRLRGHRVSR